MIGSALDHRPRLSRAIQQASTWLLDERAADGWWRDFSLAPGPSDHWVSAYVASALLETGLEAESSTAHEVWTLLVAEIDGRGGWGYNGWAPADADSTSWVLHLGDRVGGGHASATDAAHAFLRRHLVADGGLSTYADEDALRRFTRSLPGASFEGWTQSHVCVAAGTAGLRGWASLLPYLRRRQQDDGGWRSYWWSEPLYATALAVRAMIVHGQPEDRARVARAQGLAADRLRWQLVGDGVPTPFGVALGLEILAQSPCSEAVPVADTAQRWLLDHQGSDGSWEPSAWLRVPHPGVLDPEDQSQWTVGGRIEGAVVHDQHRVFTSATVLRGLAAAAESARGQDGAGS